MSIIDGPIMKGVQKLVKLIYGHIFNGGPYMVDFGQIASTSRRHNCRSAREVPAIVLTTNAFMTANAFHNITQIETSLWEAADQLRANSNLTATEYSMPVLGVIFLRHATNRYQTA